MNNEHLSTPDLVRARFRRGTTLSELLVVTVAGIVLCAALLPIASRTRTVGGDAVSMANLQTFSFAHATYAADWNDRQVTWVPDDAGLYTVASGTVNWATAYQASGACPASVLLGWDDDPYGTIWGFFLPCQSGAYPSNSIANLPISFGNLPFAFGSFRLASAKAFHDYIDGRFYSEAYYAPTDQKTFELASPHFDLTAEFTAIDGNPNVVYSSYAFSPAAMWHPDVLSFNPTTGRWWKEPWNLVDGYASPTVTQCTYPDLKTRTIEHNWNSGAPAPVNPAFAGGYTPYFFNHGAAARPLTLFFDGHIAALSTGHAVEDDAVVLAGTNGEVGLWTRDTPFGAKGYYGSQSFDDTLASHHILTADGILGRDILGPATGKSTEGSATRHPQGTSGVGPARAPKSTHRPPARPHQAITTPPGLSPTGIPFP